MVLDRNEMKEDKDEKKKRFLKSVFSCEQAFTFSFAKVVIPTTTIIIVRFD